MGYEQITDGLTLTIPTSTTQNWGPNLKQQAWKPISGHDHTTGKGNQIPTGGIANGAVTNAKLAVALQDVEAAALTPVGTTQTIDFALGKKQTLNLGSASGNVTVTLSNPVAGASYSVKVNQGATARLIVWPASVLWAQGAEPTQYQEINSKNIIWLEYDGTNYYGDWEINIA